MTRGTNKNSGIITWYKSVSLSVLSVSVSKMKVAQLTAITEYMVVLEGNSLSLIHI